MKWRHSKWRHLALRRVKNIIEFCSIFMELIDKLRCIVLKEEEWLYSSQILGLNHRLVSDLITTLIVVVV